MRWIDAVKVRPGLGMDGDDVGPGLGEGVEEIVDRRNHQMDVERLGAVRAKRLHHRRADRQVGDEMPVHHVDVDPVGAGGVDRAHLLAEAGKIGGQDRRGNERAGHVRDVPLFAAADKVHREEAVEPALLLDHPRKDAQAAVFVWRHAVDDLRRGLDSIIGPLVEEGVDLLLALGGFERADRIDEAAARAGPSRRRAAAVRPGIRPSG